MLILLNGVQVPMASALLTVWDPDRFTVIDWRALAALHAAREIATAEVAYPEYVRVCREISDRAGFSLRDVDRALWAAANNGQET